MTDTQRIENLEKRINALYDIINRNAFYTNADIDGTRQSITEITPYTETKQAYIDDTFVTFENVPQGILTVSSPAVCVVERDNSTVTVKFIEPLDRVIDVTIMVQ